MKPSSHTDTGPRRSSWNANSSPRSPRSSQLRLNLIESRIRVVRLLRVRLKYGQIRRDVDQKLRLPRRTRLDFSRLCLVITLSFSPASLKEMLWIFRRNLFETNTRIHRPDSSNCLHADSSQAVSHYVKLWSLIHRKRTPTAFWNECHLPFVNWPFIGAANSISPIL